MQELENAESSEVSTAIGTDSVILDKPSESTEPVTKIVTRDSLETSGLKQQEILTEQGILARAQSENIRDMRTLKYLLTNMSKRGIVRAVMAFLDIKKANVGVNFQTPEELECFYTGQRIMNNNHTLIHYMVKQQIRQKLESEQKQKEEKEGVSNND